MPRLSTTYKLAGPKTFRRSSCKILGKWGGNVQNFEVSLRRIAISDGWKDEIKNKLKYWMECGDTSVFSEEELLNIRVLAQTDQSGAEALIVAYDSPAGDYRKLFQNNIKVHVYVALKLFKDIWKKKLKEKGGLIEDLDMDEIDSLSIEGLKKHPYFKELDLLIKDSDGWALTERYYYLAKQTCHSANYGIEGNTFRMNILEKSGGKIVLPREKAEHFLTIYRTLFPEIPEGNRRIERAVLEHRVIYNTLGFPYYITDYNVDSKMKEYYAWPRQSTVGEITRRAISTMQQIIEKEKQQWDNLQDNHDSMLSQCRLFEVKDLYDAHQRSMNQRLISPDDGTIYNMKSETNFGFNWGKYKKDINDLGLRELKWLSTN